MKPSDFYIASRAFFGYVIPGAIVIAAGTLLWGYNPISLLASISATSIIILLIVSFFLGSAIIDLTFPFAFWIGERVVKFWQFKEQLLAWGTSSQRMRVIPRTFHEQVIKILEAKYKDEYVMYLINDYKDHVLKYYPPSEAQSSATQAVVDEYHRNLVYNDRLGPILVRLTIGKSTYLDNKITEIRDEINLAGGVVIPLFLLVISWVFHSWWYGNQVGAFANYRLVTASCVILVLIALSFARRMYSLTLSERRLWLELFMLVQLLPNDQSIREDDDGVKT